MNRSTFSFISFLFITHTIFPAQKFNAQATQDLFVAVKNADLQGVKKALAQGADPNQLDTEFPYQFPPLYYALQNNKDSSDVINTLIDAGADIYGKAKDGNAIIGFILSDNDKNSIIHLKILFKKGFDKNWKNWMGDTLAHTAKHRAEPNLLQFLLDEGINTDLENRFGETIFTIPIQRGVMRAPEIEKKVLEILANYQEKMALHKAALTRTLLKKKEQKKFGPFPTGISSIIADALVGPLTRGQKEELQRQIEQERKQSKEVDLAQELAKEKRKVAKLKRKLHDYVYGQAFDAFMKELEKD